MTKAEAARLSSIKAIENGTYERQKAERREEYAKSPRLCLECNAVISFEKRLRYRFCNHVCAALYNGRLAVPRGRCKRCGDPCYSVNKYCQTCVAAGFHLRTLRSWEKVKDNRIAKRLLISEKGHKCMTCGLSEWQGNPIPLELEHKDGDSGNWSKENLELLCPNCHALTPTYKAKNKFHGSTRQKKRRERYALGKTY